MHTLTWIATVLRVFFRVHPWTSLTAILAETFSQICNLLAFFLPLKVILLANSSNVPRYFRFFVSPEQKFGWILGLSAGAVAFYAVSLLLSAASQRIAKAGSSQVLQHANEIAATTDRRQEAQQHYARFITVAANGLLFAMGLVALAFIDPLLFALLVALLVVEFVVTDVVLRRDSDNESGSATARIHGDLPNYLGMLSAAGFLAGFFVILIPFLFQDAGNLLVAILSILILRQALTALSRGVRNIVFLWGRRQRIDPLIFRDRLYHQMERHFDKGLREVLARATRERMAAEELARVGCLVQHLRSEWRDSRIRGIYTIVLTAKLQDGGRTRAFQQQVFAGPGRGLLDHEEFLFSHVPRDALKAPEVVGRYDVGQVAVQICDYGDGQLYAASQWREIRTQIMTRHWSLAPPRPLVAAFNTSQPKLDRRLSVDLLERVAVALDSDQEVAAFERLLRILPELRRVLGAMPVYIHNPDTLHANVASTPQGGPLVMHWTRWSIEPIGITLPRPMRKAAARGALEAMRETRSIPLEKCDVEHVFLAHSCGELERHILRGSYREALKYVAMTLDNPIASDLV